MQPGGGGSAHIVLLLSALLAARATAAEAPLPLESFSNHDLNTAGPACIARFYGLTGPSGLYAAGSNCPLLIQQALSATRERLCPGSGVGVRSPLQRCMNATAASITAWTAYVTDCPVLRLRRRTPNGPPVYPAGFSCLPEFESPADFRSRFLEAKPGPFGFGQLAPSAAAASAADGGPRARSGSAAGRWLSAAAIAVAAALNLEGAGG